jgi:hypothetical protein
MDTRNLSTEVKNIKIRFLTIVKKKVTIGFKTLFYIELIEVFLIL